MGHVIAGVEGVYDRHHYLNEKAGALAQLANVLLSIIEPSDKVVKLLREVGEGMRQDPAFTDDIVSAVDVPGLERVGNGEAEYLMLVKTRPNKHFGVSRELRRRIKECFEKNGVQAAGPGRIYVADPATGKAS
jgi:small-conductance mechanosensitive channel